jgi:hypothetical protein
MKKLITAIMLTSLLFGQQPAEEEHTEAPLQEIGLEEEPAKRPKDESNLRNWVFAAASAVSVAVACIIVSLSPGDPPP